MWRGPLRAMLALIPTSPSERTQRAALAHARSGSDDTEACARLAADLARVPRRILEAELELWSSRQGYLEDRAYRLLVGVRTGVIPPPDPGQREEFEREARLGRLPLPEAFARLIEIEPTLAELESRARTRQAVLFLHALRELDDLRETCPTLAARMPFSVALTYLKQCFDDQVDARPYFEQMPIPVVLRQTINLVPPGPV